MSSPWDYPEGMTVAELKDLIKDWPEKHQDGTPTRVLVDHESVLSISPTNWQGVDSSHPTSDITFLSNKFIASKLFN